MAKFSLASLFEKLSGKLNRKDEIIYCKTRRYDSRGRVVLDDEHAYMQVEKRDFSKKPPRGDEKRNIDLITQSQQLTQQMFASNAPELLDLKTRFDRQLSTGKPDLEAPVLKKTGKQKIYTQFDRFVYAINYNRLRQQQADSDNKPR